MVTPKILIADDEPLFQELLSDGLGERGFECVCCSGVEAARRSLETTEFSAIIADIGMPGNSELEWIQEVAADATAPPVILVTGAPSNLTTIRALQLGLIDYLVKPFEMSDLVRSLDLAIERNTIHRAVGAMKNSLEEFANDMGTLETALVDGGGSDPMSRHLSPELFAQLSLSQVAKVAHILSQTLAQISAQRKDEKVDLCREFPCVRHARSTEAIQDAVDVLLATKGAFKSRSLADLRGRLENALRDA